MLANSSREMRVHHGREAGRSRNLGTQALSCKYKAEREKAMYKTFNPTQTLPLILGILTICGFLKYFPAVAKKAAFMRGECYITCGRKMCF